MCRGQCWLLLPMRGKQATSYLPFLKKQTPFWVSLSQFLIEHKAYPLLLVIFCEYVTNSVPLLVCGYSAPNTNEPSDEQSSVLWPQSQAYCVLIESLKEESAILVKRIWVKYQSNYTPFLSVLLKQCIDCLLLGTSHYICFPFTALGLCRITSACTEQTG